MSEQEVLGKNKHEIAKWETVFDNLPKGEPWPCCGQKYIHKAECPYVALVQATGGTNQVAAILPDVPFVSTLSEPSTRLLLTLCDKVTAQGSSAKFQLAMAQRELEEGLATLVSQKAEAAAPDSRAKRRRAEKAGAA